jgi:hypothetical protein
MQIKIATLSYPNLILFLEKTGVSQEINFTAEVRHSPLTQVISLENRG